MGKEQTQRSTTQTAQVEQEVPAAASPKKKKSPLKLVIVILTALIVIVVVVTGFVKFKDKIFSKKEEKKNTQIEDASTAPLREVGPVYAITPSFTVNLADPSGKRYLKVSVELELESQEMELEISKRLPQIKDAIIVLLSGKSLEDVNTNAGINQIKAEIKTRIEVFLKPGAIKNVYFTDFLIQ